MSKREDTNLRYVASVWIANTVIWIVIYVAVGSFVK